MPPMALDGGRCAYTMLVNPSGGLVGGDRLSLTASIGPDAHVLFSTPSANRIYRTTGPEAAQDIAIHIDSNARVEWLPDVTIPFAGSRFRQSIDVSLGSGTGLLLTGSFKTLAQADWGSIALITVIAAIGILSLAGAFQGWLFRRTPGYERAMLLVAGFALV